MHRRSSPFSFSGYDTRSKAFPARTSATSVAEAKIDNFHYKKLDSPARKDYIDGKMANSKFLTKIAIYLTTTSSRKWNADMTAWNDTMRKAPLAECSPPFKARSLPRATATQPAVLLFEHMANTRTSRHGARPGHPGPAHVSGSRGETSILQKIEKRVQFDLHDNKNGSVLGPYIILRTVAAALFSREAY